jgi:hypothetical protein
MKDLNKEREVKKKMCKYCKSSCRSWLEDNNLTVKGMTYSECNGYPETDKTYIDDIKEYMSAFN